MNRHLHIDPFNGIAGDMLLAGLVHLGAPEEVIREPLGRVSFPGLGALDISFPDEAQCGVRGRALRVRVDEASLPPSTGFSELADAITSVRAPARAEKLALDTLGALAEAEGKAQGIRREDVRFRGLGGFDTVLDLLGSALALEALEIGSVSCGPIPLGRGDVLCEDGLRPTPSPAAVELLVGAPTVGVDVAMELVTATGAALIRTLVDSFGPAPAMTLRAAAAGFGSSKPPGRANCVRLLLGEQTPTPPHHEWLSLLEANLDDLAPEILSTLPDTCLAAGALDAWLTPVLMKKGRPAHILSALCKNDSTANVQEAVFRHSSTLGVRIRQVERNALDRIWEEVETPWGAVRVKVGLWGDKVLNRSPEFEDCRRVAEQAGVALKEVYAAALGQRPR